MKVLITGRGTSGSWRIRGGQLATALGADAIPNALDVAPYDVAVVVKRADADLLARIHRAHVPLVWDIVDAWPQPVGNAWGKDECMAWLKQRAGEIKPAAVVAATRAMAEDCACLGLPVLALPHHARPGLEQNPVRETVRLVGYEGAEQYITGWRAAIEAECARRGWRFVVNPASLAEVDIVLALRDATGYAPRHWKSNVKLANAQGSGTPFIGCREAGYLENAIGSCEKWADTPEELSRAFDALTPQGERRRVAQWMSSVAPGLTGVAATYANWLHSACKTAPRS